ncbi:MAG: ATP-binding protein [Prolixibacteraceae bacterium]|jgi:signal transduction histidine kinase|nr:ATP-binding protein [Prolixibacteraceae bacterium]
MQTEFLKQKLDQTKDMALNRVLIVILAVMLLGIIISLLRIPQTGFTVNYVVQLILAGTLVYLYFSRYKLQTQTKGIIFLSVLYVMALSGLLSFGLYGFGYAYFIPASAIAFLYFNRKTGWAITLSSLAVIIIVGTLFNTGLLHFTPEKGYMQNIPMWLNMVITISLIAIVMTMFWSNMYNMLTNTFTHINNQQEDMKKMNADLIEARDKAQLSDRLKSSFLQNISHEIRTPLNIIIGFSDMVAQTNDPEEQLEFNKVIRENSNSMLKIVNDIVDFSKIETNTFTLNQSKFKLKEITDTIEKKSKKWIDGKPVSVKIGQMDCELETDKDRFEQILGNLIENAVKFTHEGEVILEIEQNQSFLHFRIKDTGIGIAPEEQEKIFDRFYKVDEFSCGAGLGLSISKSIAQDMGGDISVKSELGKGSGFEFKLPKID